MEEKTTENKKPIYSKVVNKLLPNNKIVGSHLFELKEFNGNLFVQIDQHKAPFGFPGTERYKPAVDNKITFDPKDEEIWKALEDIKKKVK